jgi:hypothetical protein
MERGILSTLPLNSMLLALRFVSLLPEVKGVSNASSPLEDIISLAPTIFGIPYMDMRPPTDA